MSKVAAINASNDKDDSVHHPEADFTVDRLSSRQHNALFDSSERVP